MRRPGWIRRLGPWLGIGTSPVALMVGGGVAEGHERQALVWVICAGAVLLGALAGAQGTLGQRRRARLLELAAGSLGRQGGRRVAAPVLAVMMVGWFGFNVGIAGAALGRLIGIPERAGMALFAVLMLAVAWRGLDVLSATALVAGCATVVLALWGLGLALDDRTGPLLGDGVATGSLGLLPAVALMVGYGAAFALRTPDFTSDLEHPREVVWCATVGLVVPLIAFAVAGAILQLVTGSWNLVEVLERLGSPTIAYAFVTVGFTGSVLTNLHSGAISFEETVGRLTHKGGLLAVAVAGTALAMVAFAERMVPFLTVMALAAPCLIGVLWVDHLRRRPVAMANWNPLGLAAWTLGVATGIVLWRLDSPWALPAGLLVASATATLPARRLGTNSR